MLAPTAQAGQWQVESIVATRSGTNYSWDDIERTMLSHSMKDYGKDYTNKNLTATNSSIGSTDDLWGAGAKNGQTAKASQDYDITVTVKWVANSGKTLAQDPAPDKASLLVNSRAEVRLDPGASGSYQVSNGLDSPVTIVTSSSDTSFPPALSFPGGPASTSRAYQSRGVNRLVPVEVSSGSGKATFKIHAEGSATAPTVPEGTRDPGASVDLHAVFGAKGDNRSVVLSRGVGNDSYGLPLETTVYKDGSATTYGDTLYSWVRQYSNGDYSPARDLQGFQAGYNGNWSSDYQIPGVDWNWVPDGSFQTRAATANDTTSTSFSKYNSNWIMEFGKAREDVSISGLGESSWSTESDAPKEATLKYLARDTDGAEAQAVYKITLHNPVDNVSHSVAGVDVTCGFVDVNGQPAVVDYANSLANPTINGTVGKSSGWSITGSIGDITMFKKPLGLDVGYSWSNDQGTEKSITLDKTAQPVAPGMERQVMITYKYNRHHSLFSKWNEKGKVRRLAYETGATTPNVEVPQEGFKDEYVTSSLSFGPPYDPSKVGHAPASTTPPPLPPPTSTYKS